MRTTWKERTFTGLGVAAVIVAVVLFNYLIFMYGDGGTFFGPLSDGR